MIITHHGGSGAGIVGLVLLAVLAAEVTDKLWTMDDLVAPVDEHDAKRPRQKPGRKPKAVADE